MMHLVSPSEWDRVEHALMKAEIPYKVSFDSHDIGNGDVAYDRIISIDMFKMQILEVKKDN